MMLRTAVTAPDVAIERASACIAGGGTLIFPTETVYGIGASPHDEAAIARVYLAKGRAAEKPLALHVSEIEQALPFVDEWTPCAQAAAGLFWPGPLAIVVSRRPGSFERAAAGFATISIRCPSHMLCRAILRRCGPLAATSANRSGRPAYSGEEEGVALLPEATLAILDGPTEFRAESTIVDCTGSRPKILRSGAIAASVIAEKLKRAAPASSGS